MPLRAAPGTVCAAGDCGGATNVPALTDLENDASALDRAVLDEAMRRDVTRERQKRANLWSEDASLCQPTQRVEHRPAIVDDCVKHRDAKFRAPVFERCGIQIDKPAAALEYAV
jgi:hypothetical protein